MRPPRVGRRYRALLALASAALLWERLWPKLWPAACLVGVFAAVVLLDLPRLLPPWPHALLLAVFALAVAASLFWAGRGVRRPRRAEARARLERDSGLAHAPLSTLEDRLATPGDDPLARQLWQRHQDRARSALGRLRLRPPRSDIDRHEPWGVRAGTVLLLVIALAAGWGDVEPRLQRAFALHLDGRTPPPQVELWISPPAYTRVAPIYRTAGSPPAPAPTSPPAAGEAAQDPPLRVPAGSRVLVRVTGPRRAPQLDAGGTRQALEPLSAEGEQPASWRGETTLSAGTRLAVDSGGRTLAAWPMTVIADAPPQATFAAPPSASGNGLFALDYHARDDYGVEEMVAVIAPLGIGAAADAAPRRLTLSAPGAGAAAAPAADPAAATGDAPPPDPADAPLRAVLDLAADALAGRTVTVTLQAQDAAGQVSRSDTLDFVLPERRFAHPVARRLVEERKRLFTPDNAQRLGVAQQLDAIARVPDAFAGDTVVALALAVSTARLLRDDRPDAVASVRDLLWQTALRLDQGDVPMAERQLMQAREELTQALRQGAEPAEIERLTDALQTALERYLEAVAARLAQEGAMAMPALPNAPAVHGEDLRDLVETARQLARTGSREAAMQALAELQRVLDSLLSGLAGEPSAAARQAQEMLNTLQQLAQRQQALLDRSFEQLREQRAQGQRGAPEPGAERHRRPGQGARPGTGDEALLNEQLALRRELGELMLRMDGLLGDIPAPLGEADQAMRGAAGALGQGRLGEAVPNQSRAVDALGRALDGTAAAMAQRLGGMLGFTPGGGGQRGGGDIFGRRPGGSRGHADEPLGIPEAGDLNRAQDILDELRRRAAERSRTRQELDYIDRLLRTY